ncbi:ABC transporter ATP-binding protein [Sinirhodobacter ferrireducens]|uniref:ABC transporter ATP-binding protein n=1 Tax=Paenirhodobacter ferrireducens TaxID=1215032 RepID=A0A443L4P3_9RHOB|nr:ABC transporter ATP-binding protein [Sinirhodobacter ferrireducens]RWR44140.1 ABC transporter ATP-binding protein [Sinirhodobacter ferrireducens]
MLELRDVNSFYGKAHILQDLSFSVGRGEVVALLGRNGAGKSTTMKSIIQIVRPRTGSVTLAGRELVGQPSYRVARAGIGYVPEDRRIFTALTVLENLEVGRQPRRDGAPVWTVDALFELFPNLYERRNRLGKAMSGGEQQMLTIARTLMGNPSLLLLDEPSEGIAPVIVEQMAHAILRLKAQGLTVMISEQNLHFARVVADRAIIIESGAKKFDGSFEELAAKPEIRDAYLAV